MTTRRKDIEQAKELYAAAWRDFCDTFWDDERAEAARHMRVIRQRLMDDWNIDLDRYFLGSLKGYPEYIKASADRSRFQSD